MHFFNRFFTFLRFVQNARCAFPDNQSRRAKRRNMSPGCQPANKWFPYKLARSDYLQG